MIIYKTTNLINNKIYIGQDKNNRKSYFGGGTIMRLVIKKYGKKNLIKEIIVEGDFNQALTDDLEKHYIRLYNSQNRNIGYNIEPGGRTTSETCTQETRDKISKKLKGKTRSQESKNNISKGRTGIKVSEEGKLKIVIKRKLQGLPINFIKAAKESCEKRSKKVYMHLPLGTVIEYKSILEAAKLNGIDPKSLSRGLNNKTGYFKKGDIKFKFTK